MCFSVFSWRRQHGIHTQIIIKPGTEGYQVYVCASMNRSVRLLQMASSSRGLLPPPPPHHPLQQTCTQQLLSYRSPWCNSHYEVAQDCHFPYLRSGCHSSCCNQTRAASGSTGSTAACCGPWHCRLPRKEERRTAGVAHRTRQPGEASPAPSTVSGGCRIHLPLKELAYTMALAAL